MKKKKRALAYSLRRRNGAAVVLVMLIVTVLTIAGMALLFMSYQSALSAVRIAQETACRVCTDAGLKMGLNIFNKQVSDGTLNDYSLPMSVGETLPGSQGVFSYKIIKTGGEYSAVSVGACGGFRRIITATLQTQMDTIIDYGLFSKGQLTFEQNILVSGYDSRDPFATNCTFDIGTTGTDWSLVPICTGTVVNANAFCGVGGVPNDVIPVTGTLNGTKYALTSEPEFVIPTMPSLSVKNTTQYVISSKTTFTPANSGKYNQLLISPNQELVISGGTVTIGITNINNCGFLQLESGAKITVQEGSTLILYLDGNLYGYDNITMKYAGSTIDPSHIQIYGTAAQATGWQQIALQSQSTLTAMIYAPYGHVTATSTAGIYGAIAASTINIGTGSKFYFDVALRDNPNIALQSNSSSSGYTVKRWSETTTGEIPDWAD
ncbi:MAG: hypothetical protein JW749_11910 [Sedimentisphaerales bacterium]|nr:hypothetical protein [Sedimentisphaerales bacterium]